MNILMPAINLYSILPEIILTGFAIMVLLIQFIKSIFMRNVYAYLSLAGVLLASWFVLKNFGTSSVTTFENSWIDDNYARMFKLIFLMGTGISILLSIEYINKEKIPQSEYCFLLLLTTVGMMSMAGGADMITIFLGLEILSICLYVLIGINRTKLSCIEAALKYFILGSFATAFLLYGMVLIYGITGTTTLVGFENYLEKNTLNNTILQVGVIFLVVGFGFKMAVFPFHMWAPDVYQGAPAPITAFMSVGPKAAVFAVFIRILAEIFPYLNINWKNILWIIAVVTMTIGNMIALKQDDVKRMLAYSGIAHIGYMLVGLVAVESGGISSILFYLLVYAFTNLGTFGVLILVAKKGEKDTRYKDYTGLFQTNPWTAILMLIFMLSLAGIPPTAGFMGKVYLFSAAINANYIGLAILGVLNSVISVYYYLRITIMMFMKDPERQVSPIKFSPAIIIALLAALYGVIRLGVAPSSYMAMAKSASFMLL